jgi:hypothetical protein
MKRLFTLTILTILAFTLFKLVACSGTDTAAETLSFPEQSPSLYLELITEGGPTQRTQAVQLLTNWTWDEGGYNFSSPHPLQLHQDSFEDATLYLVGESAEVELFLPEDYPPVQLSVQRWRVDFADTSDRDDGNFEVGETLEVDGKIIRLDNKDSGFSYVYEIRAEWPEHDSFVIYAFHLACVDEWASP